MSRRKYIAPSYRKILVPVSPLTDADSVIRLALALSQGGRVVVVGIVGIPAGESLSQATQPARDLRSALHAQIPSPQVLLHERVRVSYEPWNELCLVLDDEKPDLVILDWGLCNELYQSPGPLLCEQHCDLVVLRGPLPEKIGQILVTMRGSSFAERSLRLSMVLSDAQQASLTALHLKPVQLREAVDPSFRGLAKVLNHFPAIQQDVLESDDFARTIIERSSDFDLVVMGTSANPSDDENFLGTIAEQTMINSHSAVLAVRARQKQGVSSENDRSGLSAISILVDKWFAENTYSADEFADLDYLLELKRKRGLTVSLALPALNEEETVGKVIQTIQSAMMERVPLLDEIVLIDSNSTDRTREIAESLGVRVHVHQDTLPAYGARNGKGEALWKSLYVTKGDIILWIDTDIVNIHPRFVFGLLGLLLLREDIQFVKGFYRRPLKIGDTVQAGGGGRVTELTARPMLNLFYPELSGIIQPLSGEYGGRRSVLERLPFSSGYGVEIGLLIDIFENYGLSALGQVDLRNRIHHNQPLQSLSKMSFAIIQTVVRKLEQRHGWQMLEEVNQTMKLIQYNKGRLYLNVAEIAERERPPMLDVPEYRSRSIL